MKPEAHEHFRKTLRGQEERLMWLVDTRADEIAPHGLQMIAVCLKAIRNDWMRDFVESEEVHG